jgi:serine O-acetyltransferase
MERIDQLENQVGELQSCLSAVAAGGTIRDVSTGKSQNLKDREILEFLGD